jgi:hypothetical protein
MLRYTAGTLQVSDRFRVRRNAVLRVACCPVVAMDAPVDRAPVQNGQDQLGSSSYFPAPPYPESSLADVEERVGRCAKADQNVAVAAISGQKLQIYIYFLFGTTYVRT